MPEANGPDLRLAGDQTEAGMKAAWGGLSPVSLAEALVEVLFFY